MCSPDLDVVAGATGSAPAPGAAERALAVGTGAHAIEDNISITAIVRPAGIRSVRIEANKSGWTVISMKQDWESIFPK